MYHTAVGSAIVTGGSINTSNPQFAEISFLQPPVSISVITRLHYLLIGYPEQLGFTSPVSLG
jgi:hypothetical protein